MNLIRDSWIPVKTMAGVEKFIRPAELAETSDPPMAFASVRPDFDGALAQFCIGLFQTVMCPLVPEQWQRFFSDPPGVAHLDEIFDAVAPYFNQIDSDGPAFMQDLDPTLGGAGKEESLSSLLIDMPGGNTVENNATLFVKSQEGMSVAPSTAALMLLTLQINAPLGGAGHRTGLRGGGPLSTLVWPQQRANGSAASLLEKVWCNVLLTPEEQRALTLDALRSSLPWCVPTAYSQKAEAAQSKWQLSWCYWATPRPIRLVAASQFGRCALDSRIESGPLFDVYRTRNYGNNYLSDQFRHPLSPYYRLKPTDQSWLPVHPGKETGLTYVDWMAYASGAGQAAENGEDVLRQSAQVVVEAKGGQRAAILRTRFGVQINLWAFGFAMDNMKPLSWMSGTLPLILGVNDQEAEKAKDLAKKMIDAAQEAFRSLRKALKESACSRDPADLFVRTNESFYALLSEGSGQVDVRDRWRSRLHAEVLKIFEESISVANVDDLPSPVRSVAVLEKRANADFELRKSLGQGLRRALALVADSGNAKTRKPSKVQIVASTNMMGSVET